MGGWGDGWMDGWKEGCAGLWVGDEGMCGWKRFRSWNLSLTSRLPLAVHPGGPPSEACEMARRVQQTLCFWGAETVPKTLIAWVGLGEPGPRVGFHSPLPCTPVPPWPTAMRILPWRAPLLAETQTPSTPPFLLYLILSRPPADSIILLLGRLAIFFAG